MGIRVGSRAVVDVQLFSRTDRDPAAPAADPALPRTIVAIPCYNEELAIGGLVLRARRYATEVLVIDDGSSDKTVEVAKLAGATVLENPENKGKGYSIQRAFKYASKGGFDALVMMDGDGQHDPDEIPRLLEPVSGRNGSSVDIALGFRFGNLTEMPMWRRVGKRVLDYATAAGGAGIVTDSQCGYRAFGRRAIPEMARKLEKVGFGVESEQLVIANDAGLKSENVTITCKYDGIDGSTKGPVEHAVGVLRNIVEMFTMRKPLVTIGTPSIAMVLTGAYLGFLTLESYNDLRYFSMPYALGSTTLAIVGSIGLLSALNLHMLSHIERRLKLNQR